MKVNEILHTVRRIWRSERSLQCRFFGVGASISLTLKWNCETIESKVQSQT
jgi:hypothetical protein